jgi:hypothetical protein
MGGMANNKDGLYLLGGALLGLFAAVALVLIFVRPLITAHYGAVPGTKQSPAATHTETRIAIASECIGAAIGMFAGVKVYSIRQRRREAKK